MMQSCDVSTAEYENELVSSMTLFEILFKVTHDCPFCNISKGGGNRSMLWTGYSTLVFTTQRER